jgi:transposase
MFLMTAKSTSRGRSYEYVRLCESVWKNGRSSRRIIATLGRKDQLEQHLDRLFELLRGHKPSQPPNPLPLRSWRFGTFLAVRTLWHQLGLHALLGPHSDRILVLVANRLSAPASEHRLADWLRTHFACDSQGRRFVPAYRSDDERRQSNNPRVRVQAFQLQRWYRTLDALLPLKQRLEEHLFERFRNLFQPNCDLVFYDLTSTYFEGLGPGELAQRGYSRDHRPDAPQVLLGVAMVDGLPVSHTLLEGDRRDSTTVQAVVADLRQRFGLGRFVLVGDRGMKSTASLAALEDEGLGYLMAAKGRRNPRMEEALQRLQEGDWQACQDVAGEAKQNGSRVQEVTREGEPVRRIVVHSPERERHERKLREAQQEKVRQKLQRLAERVAEGEFAKRAERARAQAGSGEADQAAELQDAAALIGDAAGRILARDNGQRYYDWQLDQDGQENAHCAAERRREGHWLLETEETGLSALEAVRAYQELWRVEAAFRSLKDVLELRPVWHRTPERVQAHVLVAALALAIDRVLQRKLAAAGLDLLGTRAAWDALETVSLVEFELPGGQRKAGVCVNGEHGSEAYQVLQALGAKLEAPQVADGTVH